MKKIWKYLSFCLPVMALAVGCGEADGISEFQPDTNKSGNVTILASIENAESRASIVATGEARWKPEDGIKVVCSDGSTTIFELDGTGETRRALFTGDVSGNTIGEYALYPVTATFSGTTASIDLPAEVEASPTGDCAFMAGVINEKNEVEFKQLTAYAVIQLNNIHEKTTRLVLSADKSLSGTVSVSLPEGLTEGALAQAGNGTVTIKLGEKVPTMVNAFIPIPVGEYTHLTVTAYNAKDNNIGEVALAGLVTASRGLLLNYAADMPDHIEYEKPAPIAGTVNVAGIYWALGNLQYDKDCVASTGFAAGWRIAPNQAHFIRCEEKASGDITGLANFDRYDHFNFGGIAAPFSALATDAIDVATAGFNFGGKMYTDQACTAETTDFAAAKYGDIAHWASGGQYRMPSDEDFNTLLAKASAQVATYNLNGADIAGMYFFDPEPGQDPVQNMTETKVLTDADLEVGLFLPYAGRGYNKESTQYNIYKLGSQCWHRTSVVDTNSAAGACYGVIYAPHYLASDLTKVSYYYNSAYGSTGRYSIRPVYVGGGSGVVPTPPTTDPDPTPGDPTPGEPSTTVSSVTVAGIEWATGNLEYEVGGATSDGFVTGWHIAPNQEHHYYIGLTGTNEDITTYDKVAHFNFGGIGENAYNVATTSCVHIEATANPFDFSGKMYTDQSCINATTDFAAAKYGDVAYWASNGKYCMPTKADMEKLYAEACRTAAIYNGVNGVYYYNPGAGETAGVVEGVKELKSADMAVGLFLPNSGRGYDNKDYTLYNIDGLGTYRTSTVQENSKSGVQGYGVIYRTSKLEEGDYYNKTVRAEPPTYAYGACARYAIRPKKVK